MDAYQLLELLQDHVSACEEADIKPTLSVITQPSWPLKGRIVGIKADEETGTFTLGIESGTEGYADSSELEGLDGF